MLTTQELNNLIELAEHGTVDDLGVAVAIIDALEIDFLSKLIIVKHSNNLRQWYSYTIQSYFTGGVMNYSRIYDQHVYYRNEPNDNFIQLFKWSLEKEFGSLEKAKDYLDAKVSKINILETYEDFRKFIRSL
jgi:hypothetical protein